MAERKVTYVEVEIARCGEVMKKLQVWERVGMQQVWFEVRGKGQVWEA